MNPKTRSSLAAITPKTLDFGALAAERDILGGLKSYFIESEAFRNLRDGRKHVALGNRGAGKSAIFKIIAERERAQDSIVLELTPEEYSYELLTKAMLPEQRGSWAKQGAYAAAWKYLIYVLAMKHALKKVGRGLKTGGDRQIYEYLRDHHKNTEANPIGTLISYLKRLEGVKIGKYEAGLKATELHHLYKLEEIAHLLKPLDDLSRKHRIVILIDELDKGWDRSEDAVSFVAGLFQAAYSMSQQTPNIRILISLRRELYESIPALYEDAQKVRDIIQEIEWDEPELKDLIAKRIAYSAGQTDADSENLWNAVFSETLDYRQTKSFNYMIDRTLYRPREIIQFCILVREKLVTAKHTLPADYRIISQAELDYSEERTKDIAAEYRFQYAGLRSVFETFRGLSYNFERDDLQLHCLGIATGEMKVDADAASWCLGVEPDHLIGILWDVGFVRAQAVGGLKARRRSGSTYLGSHQIASLSLSNIPRFHVHPMFRAFLGMKETKTAS